jgi:hypothetical protein
MFDPQMQDGMRIRVRDHGILSGPERDLIGKTGRVVRAYVASCRVEIDGKAVSLPKVALELTGD